MALAAAARAEVAVREAADAVRLARRFVTTQLDRWAVSSNIVSDAVLVASELVTNALRHGAAPRRLELELSPDRLRIAVSDAGSGRPRRRASDQADDDDDDQENGRGLALLEAIGSDWGTEAKAATGKCVWCDLVLHQDAPAR